LSGTQFSTLNSAAINDPEGPEKYNNTKVKYGASFYSCHWHLTPAVVKYKNLETGDQDATSPQRNTFILKNLEISAQRNKYLDGDVEYFIS
jgi:hypothetical protein